MISKRYYKFISSKINVLTFLVLQLMISCVYASETTKCEKVKKALRESEYSQDGASQSIIQNFQNRIDWTNLEKYNYKLFHEVTGLLEKMSSVDIYASLNQSLFCESKRSSEFYLPNEFKALLNPELFSLFEPDSMSPKMRVSLPQFNSVYSSAVQLVLHILIGASGYYDENYEKSLGLASLVSLFPALKQRKNEETEEFNELKEVLLKIFVSNKQSLLSQTTTPLNLADGGSSGVSGGGDLQSILIKSYLLQNNLLYKIINKKCQTDSEWSDLDKTMLDSICYEWPSIKELLYFLFTFNLESSIEVSRVEYQISEKNTLSIIMPKIKLDVWMHMNDNEILMIIRSMTYHIIRSIYEKNSRKR